MITIIHASRSRPSQALATFRKWTSNSGRDERYLLSLDKDDPQLEKYFDLFPDYFSLANTSNNSKIIINTTSTAIAAINNAAKEAYGIIVVISDDFDPCNNWHYEIEQIGRSNRDWILKTYDGIQPWIITLPIMDDVYYKRFGYIYYPEYKHMFPDTEMTCVADLLGRKIESNLLFKHNKYEQKPDDVSRKADATWNHGENLFIQRAKNKFGLKPDQIKGKVTSQDYINWARNKGIQL